MPGTGPCRTVEWRRSFFVEGELVRFVEGELFVVRFIFSRSRNYSSSNGRRLWKFFRRGRAASEMLSLESSPVRGTNFHGWFVSPSLNDQDLSAPKTDLPIFVDIAHPHKNCYRKKTGFFKDGGGLLVPEEVEILVPTTTTTSRLRSDNCSKSTSPKKILQISICAPTTARKARPQKKFCRRAPIASDCVLKKNLRLGDSLR